MAQPVDISKAVERQKEARLGLIRKFLPGLKRSIKPPTAPRVNPYASSRAVPNPLPGSISRVDAIVGLGTAGFTGLSLAPFLALRRYASMKFDPDGTAARDQELIDRVKRMFNPWQAKKQQVSSLGGRPVDISKAAQAFVDRCIEEGKSPLMVKVAAFAAESRGGLDGLSAACEPLLEKVAEQQKEAGFPLVLPALGWAAKQLALWGGLYGAGWAGGKAIDHFWPGDQGGQAGQAGQGGDWAQMLSQYGPTALSALSLLGGGNKNNANQPQYKPMEMPKPDYRNTPSTYAPKMPKFNFGSPKPPATPKPPAAPKPNPQRVTQTRPPGGGGLHPKF